MKSEWPKIYLEQIAQINPKRKLTKGQICPFIDMAALPQNARDINFANIVPRIAKNAGSHFRNGDTLLARITPCLENGKTAQVNCLPNDIVGEGSTEFIVLCGKDLADNDFIYYLSRSPDFRKYAIGRMEGTSGRQRVSWQAIANFEFTCPPITDRRNIANILSILDDRINLLTETNTTLEAIAQALFKSWFIDFDPVHAKMQGQAPQGMDEATAALFPDSFEESELGPIPKGWAIKPLKHFCERVESGGTPKRNQPEYWDGQIYWLSSGEVRNPIILTTKERITHSGLKNSSAKLWPSGTTVVAMYGATAGEVCLLAEAVSANQACCGLIPKEGFRSFLYLTVMGERVNLASKSSGSAQQNLNKGLVEGHTSILPHPKVVLAFEAICGELINKRIENTRRTETLSAIRDQLLPRLISGQLEISEVNLS